MAKLGSALGAAIGAELSSITTTNRNAGMSTATGTIIYNSTTEALEVYFGDPVGWQKVHGSGDGVTPFSATGGTKTTDGAYTVHTFTSTGPFVLTGGPPAGVELTIMAVGGGGGAFARGGGGGAPAILVKKEGVQPGTYTMTVGGGGASSSAGGQTIAFDGQGFNEVVNGGGTGRASPAPITYGQIGGDCPPSQANDIGNAWGGFVAGDNTPGWAQYYRGVGGAGARNNGLTNVPTGADGVLLTTDGNSYYYGGGGGGGAAVYAGPGGAGGKGGGGGGSGPSGPRAGDTNGRNAGGSPGTGGANTGGGGGATNNAGGSGIIIIRYLTT